MILISAEGDEVEPLSEEDIGLCPNCNAEIPLDSPRCPNCGIDFEQDNSSEAGEDDLGSDYSLDDKEIEHLLKEEKKTRTLFFIGVILVLIGGPGIALFSYVHNLTDFPAEWNGSPIYTGYGYLDWILGSVGSITLLVGIIFVLLSFAGRDEIKEYDEEDYGV